MPEWMIETIDGEPVGQWDQVFEACRKHKRAAIIVEKYSEERAISRQQMAYLHPVVFPRLAKEMECSLWEAEFTCKTQCGEQWLIKDLCGARFVLSKTSLSIKDCNAWIENIWDWCDRHGIHMPAPDKDWRVNAEKDSAKEKS